MNQPFVAHLHEARRRLTWSAAVALVGAVAGYAWRSPILSWLEAPLRQTLYYSQVTGAFTFVAQVCLTVGLLLAAPMIVYQVVAFASPALPRPIGRRETMAIVVLAAVLVAAGVAFGYYVSLPVALHFLGSIDATHLHPLLAADSYLTFVLNYLAVFGLIFLLPVVVALIDRGWPLRPATLARARKWIILGAFSAALVLPVAPDPVSQVLLAVPVIAAYEVSIWWIRFKRWRHRRLVAPAVITTPESLVRPTPQRRRAHGRVIDLRRPQ